MDRIGSFLKSFLDLKGLHSKVLLVVLAFVLMVVSSCFYVSSILHSHLEKEAESILTNSKGKITTEIAEAEVTLGNISSEVREMIIHGDNEKMVSDYMVKLHTRMINDVIADKQYYSDVYGYFDVFGGKLITGSGWIPPQDFITKERPWYIAAVEGDGAIAIAPVYRKADTNRSVMTFSIRLFDDNHKPLCVLGLDVPLDVMVANMSAMNLTENSYGLLENINKDIIAHPNLDYIGSNMRDINEWLYNSTSVAEQGTNYSIFQTDTRNYKGEQTVVFTSQLENGWLLSVVVPKGEYYQGLVRMIVVFSVLGTVLAAMLVIILLRIENAKRRAGDIAREQSILLEAMTKKQEMGNLTQLMLDATPMSCKLWSRELKVFACNEEAVRVFGVSSKEEFCNRFFELCPEYQPSGVKTSEKAREYLLKAFEEGYQRFEWMHQKLNGELIPAEITLVRVAYEDDYVVAGYIRDMTEHKKMLGELTKAADDLRTSRDLAESANHAKSSFLANMSHEMRTPLNVVVGLTDLRMEEEDLPDEIQSDIRKINNAGNTLLSIVNDVLDISKIEAGKLELIPVLYNTASLFNDVITLNVIRIESKPITFKIDIDENIPCDIYGDELRIKQIFNNLLSNAFKYTHEGVVTLKVEYETVENKDVWMTISVKDSGIGIRQDDLKKLFSNYNQVDTKANRHIEGTGLGLSIAKRLVELMDGEITVESEYGKGTTFSVRIRQGFITGEPLGQDVVENLRSFHYQDTKAHISSKLVRIDMSYARVLVVDDFQTNLDVAAGMMRKYKMQVDCVISGQDAVDRIDSGVPVYNAIFMDHMMPGMDGIEATKRIRALDSEYAKKIPIISLTANAIAGNEQMFLDSGFQAFLSKPIDIMKLDLILRQWIRDKSKEATIHADSPLVALEPENSGSAIQIEGINEKKGLSLYGDDLELYLSVLRSYAANTPAVIDSLRFVSEENLAAYATDVHGLKGSSGSIGAEGIRSKAARLEAAAKAGDLVAVLAENETLLNDAQLLLTAVQGWLEKQDSISEKPRLPYPEPALLDNLRQCCEEFDMNGADAAMEQLESVCYDTGNDLIVWLREKIDISDFPAIAERIKDLHSRIA